MVWSINVFCCLLIVPILCLLENVNRQDFILQVVLKYCVFAWVALTLTKLQWGHPSIYRFIECGHFWENKAGGMESPDRGGCWLRALLAGILCLLSSAGPIVSHCDELTNSRDMGLGTSGTPGGKGSALNTDRVTRAQSRMGEKILPVRTSYFPIKLFTRQNRFGLQLLKQIQF